MSAYLSPHQCRFGRELAGLSFKSLAERAGLKPSIVFGFEAGEVAASETVMRLRRALEAVNIIFSGRAVGFRPAGKSNDSTVFCRRRLTRP